MIHILQDLPPAVKALEFTLSTGEADRWKHMPVIPVQAVIEVFGPGNGYHELWGEISLADSPGSGKELFKGQANKLGKKLA